MPLINKKNIIENLIDYIILFTTTIIIIII
jgi:hypothetical protein